LDSQGRMQLDIDELKNKNNKGPRANENRYLCSVTQYWKQINGFFISGDIQNAYELALSNADSSNSEDSETDLFLMIRLMGKTGVCLKQLTPDLTSQILDWSIKVL
jgi:hypothetical protein